MKYLAVDHPRFRKVQASIFTKRVTLDCMNHTCTLVDEKRVKLDACCQYGAQADLGERDNILARTEELKALLNANVRDVPWFSEEEADADFPSGKFVRMRQVDDGCVFLHHDKRGCAIHRASMEGGWDFHGTKPHVCRLFPLSYESDAIVISDDYPDYSCAYLPDAPTLYQGSRDTLAAIFGEDLVRALDAVEALALEAGDSEQAGLVAADQPLISSEQLTRRAT